MNRKVLITGASGNLGRTVVSKLSEDGCTIIAAVKAHEMPEELKQKIAYLNHVDLLQETATAEFIATVLQQYPDLDAAVLLAGGYAPGSFEETSKSLLDDQFDLNYKTAWNVIRPLLPHFKARGGGQIILMGARPGISPKDAKQAVAYGLSKSLLFTLADMINAQEKEYKTTASVIAPSTLDTQPNRESMPNANFDHWVKTEDVADTISYILSDAGKI